jgi:HEPN superfamily RiboL-PSP-like protein
MSPFESAVNAFYDARVSTLAAIKARSIDADTLVLSALTVLAYAQLEGGVKDISACVIKHVNRMKLEWGEVSPRLLKWRNQEDLARFRAAVDFDMIGAADPFAPLLKKRAQIRPISRRGELNQMTWSSLRGVYDGFGLDSKDIEQSAANIDSLVGARNDAAHRGVLPITTAKMLERQVREHVSIVENVLTDLALQLFAYFNNSLHRR